MRFIFFGLGALIVLGLLFWLFKPDPVITNYPSSGTEIIALGDSLIEGVGATAGNDLISLLETAIDEPILNLGVSGDTTNEALAMVADVIDRDPKVVIVLIGGNDAIRQIPIETTRSNISSMIEQIHTTGAVVLLLGVRGGLLSDSYKDMYKDLAKEHGTAFVPNVLDGVFAHPNLMADPIHPNDAGYKKIFERVLPVLESVL